jgi:hypothetical protein
VSIKYLNADSIYFYDNLSLIEMKPYTILYENELKVGSSIKVQQIPLTFESALKILQFYVRRMKYRIILLAYYIWLASEFL